LVPVSRFSDQFEAAAWVPTVTEALLMGVIEVRRSGC
jgi:hypothetical protein